MTEPASPSSPPTAVRRTVTLLLLAVLVLSPGFFAVRRSRSASAEEKSLVHEAGLGARLKVADVLMSPPARKLALIGEARPWASVTLYAKVSGYLRTVRVDKGDRVKAGDLVAELESPEIDRAYAAAKVEHANRVAIANRLQQLVARKLVSPQESEQAATDATVADERLQAAAAEKEYETIRAPFDGTVIARYADPGALMQSASASQTSALPVATISRNDRLRITVYLDQADAVDLKPGAVAVVTMPEHPGFSRRGVVTRAAGALDPRTRKMLAEVDLENGDGAIIAGATVAVSIELPVPKAPQVPAEAIVIRGGKPYVAVVGADSIAHFRLVTTGVTDGATIAVLSGLKPGERVGLNVGDLADSSRVRPVSAAKP
ncbi:MAG: efflux RND transporter periplasmic adaptor subunit [Gemmatimonadetes bacterium]|nr:efflux RND transporter periplasmic adaptor subunit [Gemmatimonadota bacterium]